MRRAWTLGAGVFALDRAAKLLIGGVDARVLFGLFRLRETHNTGAAFSLLAGRPALLLALTGALLAAAFFLLRPYRLSGAAAAGASLIAGGAAGNLADRLLYGYVIDMIEPTFVPFAVFNVADMGIVAGAALVCWSILKRPQDWGKRHG